jgi:hypothetical protein
VVHMLDGLVLEDSPVENRRDAARDLVEMGAIEKINTQPSNGLSGSLTVPVGLGTQHPET